MAIPTIHGFVCVLLLTSCALADETEPAAQTQQRTEDVEKPAVESRLPIWEYDTGG